ncbi:DUF1707 and FHA domain-containing protein [Streptomyces sp. ISL-11]|uniref:DUF1707 and FHA domain-containing protein n=1 Tax=Streptomyces sp. ISL-11 TaxID=2819174 RepID=UPI001BE71161|nr:DUF1707 and FHA domain-containing protein [Streptomyces sp. ISL-11]MBT2382220.1 FHA domain-containing protein [Streptomyces sp. ISL-11]
MTSPEFRTRVTRPSEAERERALVILRDGTGDGRLSHDTFMRRMDLVLTARSSAEIDLVMADLPSRGRFSDFVLRAVGRLSAFAAGVRGAWRGARLPGLRLPEPGTKPLSIGRAPVSGLRLGDDTVSRRHAELRWLDHGWRLTDLGSRNGTYVNGLRIAGSVRVGPGDHVAFGDLSFRLSV